MMESIFLTLVFFMPLMGHPLTLGFLVLSISSLSSIILCKLLVSWFGYSLFLVYVGGVLVMFSYVVALSPNLSGFNLNYFSLVGLGLVFINFGLVFFMDINIYWDFDSFSKGFNLKELSIMSGLFDNSNIMVMFFLLLMLLITMVMVVKICYYRSGPLRPFN